MNLRTEIVGLSAGYALLGLLLLLALTRTRLPWTLKAGLIALTSAFYVIVFLRTGGLLGWSALEPLPARFQLLWVRTVEPNFALEERGAIHLWIEELDDDNFPSGAPRAYQLPYSTGLARKVESARIEISNGHPQAGRAEQFGATGSPPVAEGVPVRPAADPGGDPSGGGLLDPAFFGGESQSVEFAPMPAPVLPPKGLP
jgi:hypothetical protein